ncbi:MAG: siphovirus ReqiPepy6 Gp37-like family protein [Lachnospiraceae bacterium]|nr:siphovirus ReqiPepy6 Gp37-like family protein [Lachnospiraceae bacterium]MCM1239952.1 siphovirus ReqiPepy6 Gp37-like family protein [Lachnospiraceae bacterium]
MEIYIMDRDLDVIGVVSTYDSIRWINKFYEPGTFEAVFAFTDHMNSRLQCGNLLYKEDEPEPGIITGKHIKLDKRGKQTIQVWGRMASSFLSRRIIWEKTILEGTPEEAMRQLVLQQVITPMNINRKMPLISLGALKGYNGTISKQVTYDNLQETLTAIAMASGLGYRLRLDIDEKKFLFEVLRGEDRTAGSSHPCIFSRDFQSVYTQDYVEDGSNYRNICLIGGAGEDEGRTMAIVGEAEGMERYEMFCNAAYLDADDTDAGYIARLEQKGVEKLNSYALAKSFENKINWSKAMPHDLGDLVTCTDEQWGITMDAQITAIEKGYSRTEESYVVTLGIQAPTLIDLIKAKE